MADAVDIIWHVMSTFTPTVCECALNTCTIKAVSFRVSSLAYGVLWSGPTKSIYSWSYICSRLVVQTLMLGLHTQTRPDAMN